MLDICEGFSKEFKEIIHKLLDIIVDHFIEIGGNLEYEYIYATVFPLHLQEDKERGLNFLKKLHRHIIDNFNHEFSPLDEFVLYNILMFVYESSEDGFELDDIVKDYCSSRESWKRMQHGELQLLRSVKTPSDLIGICFEDVDFLDVDKFFEWHKVSPYITTDFFHVDLDYYTELMPEDILLEYQRIKEHLKTAESMEKVEANQKQFRQVVISLVETFNHYVVHKKVHSVLNGSLGELDEKGVQVIFSMYAKEYLKNYDIVISPEVDTGRGTVDFYLSHGLKHQALLEFKLGSSKKVDDGMNYQLPMYLITEDIELGIFVLICYSEEIYKAAEYLYGNAKELSTKYKKDIQFIRIDASGTSKTASKIKSDLEMRMEDWRDFN